MGSTHQTAALPTTCELWQPVMSPDATECPVGSTVTPFESHGARWPRVNTGGIPWIMGKRYTKVIFRRASGAAGRQGPWRSSRSFCAPCMRLRRCTHFHKWNGVQFIAYLFRSTAQLSFSPGSQRWLFCTALCIICSPYLVHNKQGFVLCFEILLCKLLFKCLGP